MNEYKHITLADIEASEKICEDFNKVIETGFDTLEMDGVDAIKLIGDFSHHARDRLPKMNKLVREILEDLEQIAFVGCDCPAAVNPEEFYRSQLQLCYSTAMRLVKRIQG